MIRELVVACGLLFPILCAWGVSIFGGSIAKVTSNSGTCVALDSRTPISVGRPVEAPIVAASVFDLIYPGPKETLEIVLENWEGGVRTEEVLYARAFGNIEITNIENGYTWRAVDPLTQEKQTVSFWVERLPADASSTTNAYIRIGIGVPEELEFVQWHEKRAMVSAFAAGAGRHVETSVFSGKGDYAVEKASGVCTFVDGDGFEFYRVVGVPAGVEFNLMDTLSDPDLSNESKVIISRFIVRFS